MHFVHNQKRLCVGQVLLCRPSQRVLTASQGDNKLDANHQLFGPSIALLRSQAMACDVQEREIADIFIRRLRTKIVRYE